MPFQNNSDGPWGGGGKNRGSGGGGGGGRGPWGGGGGGGRGPGGPNGQGPDMDELLKQGRDRLKVIFGGEGGGGGRGGGPSLPEGLGRGGWIILGVGALLAWFAASVYTVAPEERSVELTFGEFSSIGESGLNFAIWPVQTYEKLAVTRENVISLGDNSAFARGGQRADQGLILTGDENIVDIDFQVVWNITDPARFLFNLAEPEATIRAVSEASMREIVGRSELSPILNRDREALAREVEDLIQSTLDSYNSGVNIVRLTLDRADPPEEVIDAFRDVQAAAQDRVRSENQAEAYANQRLAQARGESAQLIQEAEAYAARVVNEATGEAARFISIYDEYKNAEEVTRKRLYLETMERVLSDVDKIIIDGGISGGGDGVVPYLPLNELRRGTN
ncbi:MAG: FtsH protease activity modulator HflK [Pseudomonadota bacterium]